jgi:hypothetical protein
MMLMTKAQRDQMIENHIQSQRSPNKAIDHKPVIKLFGGGACTWLLTEYSPDEDLFFGLCDLGLGFPELGYVSKEELEEIRFPPLGLPVERDRSFLADKTLSQYADEAKNLGRINA